MCGKKEIERRRAGAGERVGEGREGRGGRRECMANDPKSSAHWEWGRTADLPALQVEGT